MRTSRLSLGLGINKMPWMGIIPTPSPTPTPTVTPTNTVTPTRTVTPTVTVTPTSTVTPTPTITPTVTPTVTPTNTVTPTVSPTVTPTETVTPTVTPSFVPPPPPPHTVAAFVGSAAGEADGASTVATFSNLRPSITVDPANNDLFVIQESNTNARIRRITSAGTVTTPNTYTAGANRFTSSIFFTNNTLYISRDQFIYTITINPAATTTIVGASYPRVVYDQNPNGWDYRNGTGTDVNNGPRLADIKGCVRIPNGNFFICDRSNHCIRQMTADTFAVTTFAGANPTQLARPLWMSPLDTPPSAGTSGTTDGTGTAARFNSPHSIARDSNNNLFVTDAGNHTIRRITTGGAVTTLAGSAGNTGSTDGTGEDARFNNPTGITVDLATNNIYITDTGNHTIRRITPDGVVDTIAGIAGTTGTVNGDGDDATFNTPAGIVYAAPNLLFVVDQANNRIRQITIPR